MRSNQDISVEAADEFISVDSITPVTLTVPDNANYAVIAVEADSNSASPARCIKFRQDGGTVTAVNGSGMGDNEVRTILTLRNLKRFQAIGINAGEVHTLTVEYFQ